MFDQICVTDILPHDFFRQERDHDISRNGYMSACVRDIGYQAAYLKTRAQLFNRRKSRNKKLKALRCLQVNTYFGRMKHWPATQSSSSTADASIDNDERYAYRDE